MVPDTSRYITGVIWTYGKVMIPLLKLFVPGTLLTGGTRLKCKKKWKQSCCTVLSEKSPCCKLFGSKGGRERIASPPPFERLPTSQLEKDEKIRFWGSSLTLTAPTGWSKNEFTGLLKNTLESVDGRQGKDVTGVTVFTYYQNLVNKNSSESALEIATI